jgi:hypothetical protein
MQGGLHSRDGAPQDLSNLLERIPKDIHEDHRAALSHRQPHEAPEAGGGDLPVLGWIRGVDGHVRILVGMGRLLTCPSSEEVQGGIVGNS